MGNNLTGLNVATRTGEGNANVLSWGNLDRAANQLYQEQKLREARGYNDYMQGQSALQKEFANVRSADIPDVVNAYNDLKKTKQAILFDDKIKNDAVSLAQKQQEANIKEAQLRQLINGSQQLKETDKAINARKLSHADDYDSEKVKQHAIDLNLPLMQRIKEGRIDDTPYRYEGGDGSKLLPVVKQAIGTQRAVPIGDELPTEDKDFFERKHILRSNNPVQYANTMYQGMQTNKMGQYAASQLNKLSPQDVATIVSKFNNIPDAEFEQKWGVKKEALTKGVLPDDKAGQYVLLDAMQYAVNNLPQATDSKFRSNKEGGREFSKEEFNRRNTITSRQIDNRAAIRAANVVNGQYNPQVHVNALYDNGEVDNKKYPIGGGKYVSGKDISLPDELQDKFYDKIGGVVFRPDKVIMDNDKKNIHLIYFNGKNEKGEDRVKIQDTRTIPINSALVPTLEKVYGNSKKNLYSNSSVQPTKSAAPKVETKTFVFPSGKNKF